MSNILYTILYCLLIGLTLCTVGIWFTYAIIMINRQYLSFKKYLKMLKASPGDNNYFEILMRTQLHYSGLINFALLLAIGIIGGLGLTLVWIYRLIPSSDVTLKQSGSNFTDFVDICETKNEGFYKKLSHFSLFGFSELFTAIPYCCFLLTVSLSISLMKLKVTQVLCDNAWFGATRRSYYKWILTSAGLSSFVLILTAVPYTRLLIRPIILTLSILYLICLYLSTRKLKKVLTQYVSKRLKEFGENNKKKYQVKIFTITSVVVLTVYSIVTVVVVIDEVQFYIATILYFGKCYIPLLYNTSYTPLLTTQQQQITLFKFNYYVTMVNRKFSEICATLILITLVVITFLMVARQLKQLFSQKKEKRYNAGSLGQKLIPKNNPDCAAK